MNYPYFRTQEGDPAPLTVTVERQVRFEEVDPLAIVWHGRYPSFFEDARVAFGARYGIGYLDCYANGFMTPIKKMHVDYIRPLRFPEPFTIEGILHWSPAARLNFSFVIRNAAGEMTTTGYTVQMMVDQEQNVLLIPPAFIQDFHQRWREGTLA